MNYLNPALIKVTELYIPKPKRTFKQRLALAVNSAVSNSQVSYPYGKLRTITAGSK